MNQQRLLALADFIEPLPTHKLNMSVVALINLDAPKMDPFKCTSVGCAMGWTPYVFPDLVQYSKFTLGEFRTYCKNNKGGYPLAVELRKDPDTTEQEAMEELFDIDAHAAAQLFGSGGRGYQTPKEVAAGIRRFAKEGILPFEHHVHEDEREVVNG